MTSGDSISKPFGEVPKRAGKGPSKEHPCARCQSHDHWVVDCPCPPSANEGSGVRGKKGKKKSGWKANAQAAISTSPTTTPTSNSTALIAHSNIASFNDKSEIAHLHLTIDEVTLFAAHSSQWIMDSGASENMTGDRAWFDSLQPLASTVRIATAGGTSLAADSAGPVSLANHRGERVVLGRVLLVHGLAFNLLSVSRLDSVGAEIVFGNSLCRVSKGGVEVLRADQEQKVWVVKGSQWKSGILEFERSRVWSKLFLQSLSQPRTCLSHKASRHRGRRRDGPSGIGGSLTSGSTQ